MMLSKKFVKGVLRNLALASRVLSVVVDEAHVVSHWGSCEQAQLLSPPPIERLGRSKYPSLFE